MKKFSVTIHFEKYMQDRFDDQTFEAWLKNRGQLIEGRNLANDSPEAKAEFSCYRDDEGKCYFPNIHLKQALINGATQVKSKVGTGRRSMSAHAAAFFEIFPEHISVRNWDVVDKRPAVNRKAGARVMKYRPRWNDLKISFELIIKNDNIFTDDSIFDDKKGIFYFAGTMFGCGNYTPLHKGEFGTFTVVKWKELN